MSAPSRWSLALAAGLIVVASSRGLRADDNVRFVDLSGGAPPPTKADLRRVLPFLSNGATREYLARELGLNEVAGKPIDPKPVAALAATRTPDQPILAAGDFDHMISGDPNSILGSQQNPTIAVNPVDQNIVVAIAENSHSITGNTVDCSVYVSRNGGAAYLYAFDLGIYVQTASPSCVSPKAVFSPDGSYLYVTNLELGTTAPSGIVSTQLYDGFTLAHYGGWVFGYGGTTLGSPSIGVHAWDAGGNADQTYVVLTNYWGTGCSIEEISYTGHLASYSFHTLASLTNCTGPFPTGRLVDGATVAGGPGTEVLACWFDSGIDGYSTLQQQFPPPPGTPLIPLNKFNVACRSSNDHGSTWAGDFNPPESVTPPDYSKWIYAAKDVVSEVPVWMGPNSSFFYIASSQDPSLTIDHLGTAHVVFSYGIPANKYKSDNTNVAYVSSTDFAPTATIPTIYSKWSHKTLLASGPGAQLFPTVVSQRVQESPKPYIYAAWLDTAASAALGAANANRIYDARYRLSTTGGKGFGKVAIAADHASVSAFLSVGNYIGVAASTGIFHFTWTDRRAALSAADPREHIFAERY